MANQTRIKLPGFGLPLDSMLKKHDYGETRLPHAIADYFTTDGITLRELTMLEFINQITDKPNWTEKIHDETIVEKWRKEAYGTKRQQKYSPKHLSDKCFDYCVAELRDKAQYFQQHCIVHVLDVIATIVKADLAEDDDFAQRLSEAVVLLEDVPEPHKDWHPGSDGLVLDLVHPSLCPLQYGKSRVLPYHTVPLNDCNEWIGCGEICPSLEDIVQNMQIERTVGYHDTSLRPWGNYQWLPSDVRFDESGTAKIMSYINNLHPLPHGELYKLLEQAVDKAVPLWNDCLSIFNDRMRLKVERTGFEDFRNGRLTMAESEDVEMSNNREVGPMEDSVEDEQHDQHESEDEDWSDWNELQHDWIENNPDKREISQPDPDAPYATFAEQQYKPGLRLRDLRKDLPDGLQIIFKLANIHLTPDKPRYQGSNWHVEGALNEHICATALVYYDQENIEDSYLEFRHEIANENMVLKPEQYEYQACEDLFGVAQDGVGLQEIGKVLTRNGRILAFPNVMQHRVRPFSLADPSKPGHRKILAMFLVDPNIRIVSTANVPPQQRAWWADELRKIEPFNGLPVELFDRIIEDVDDFPIGWNEACEVREALMAERGLAQDEFDQALRENTFYFCEH